MIVFNSAIGKTTLDDSVKDWTFEQLKEAFEGKLDYVGLAKQLGIKPEKPKFVSKAKEKSVESLEDKK